MTNILVQFIAAMICLAVQGHDGNDNSGKQAPSCACLLVFVLYYFVDSILSHAPNVLVSSQFHEIGNKDHTTHREEKGDSLSGSILGDQ